MAVPGTLNEPLSPMTVGIPETEHAVYDNVGTLHCRIRDMTGFDHMKNPLHKVLDALADMPGFVGALRARLARGAKLGQRRRAWLDVGVIRWSASHAPLKTLLVPARGRRSSSGTAFASRHC